MEALVYKSTGSWYVVKTGDGNIYKARVKGRFKMEGITSTNPVAVGDMVNIEMEAGEENTAVIDLIVDRKNYIIRQSPHNKNQHHIIASNLDQSILFATVKNPKTSTGFIDRFLVASEAYHVNAILVFNKADDFNKNDHKKYETLSNIYNSIGYKVLLISVVNKTGLHELAALLHNKTSLMSGHSGVGKSSFVNYVLPASKIKTQDVSGWSGKGLHTTTFAEMFDLEEGGKIIDTPGLREFALSDIDQYELAHYFPEMRRLLPQCQFNNCVHINEPGCAVKQALDDGIISISRYNGYINILNTMADKYN
ncbi:MAG: ribosome small subunit-dependent GTPase A [Ginsengibacter sp.]